MRPVKSKEYKRMQQQTESALAGRSEIGFSMLAKESGQTAKRWIESGFICDFHIPRFSDRTKQNQIGWFGDPALEAVIQGYAKMPMRYVTNDAFTVKANDLVAAPWKGQVFGVTPFVSVGTINAGTAFGPIVESVVLLNFNDMEPELIRYFDIKSQPYIQADGFMLELEAKDTGTYIGVNWGRFDRRGPSGYGVVIGGLRSKTVAYYASIGPNSVGGYNLYGTSWTNGSGRKLR